MADPLLDIAFTAPHPDDLEIGMGGAIAKLVKQGYRVGMFHMTDGEPTPRGDPQTRVREMQAAAKVLGAQVCEILGMTNRELMDSPQPRYLLATALRKYRPRILVAMAGRTPAASPDHYQGQLIAEAARFYSQLTKWNDRFAGTEPYRVDHLVYRPTRIAAETTLWHSQFVVDISDTIEQKIEAVRCYASQFDAQRFAYLEHYIRSWAGAEGASIGVKWGELYALPRPLGVEDMVAIFSEWKVPSPLQGLRSPQ